MTVAVAVAVAMVVVVVVVVGVVAVVVAVVFTAIRGACSVGDDGCAGVGGGGGEGGGVAVAAVSLCSKASGWGYRIEAFLVAFSRFCDYIYGVSPGMLTEYR